MVPGGAAAEKAHGAAIDRAFRFERGRPVDLAAEAKLRVFVRPHDARFGLAQTCQYFLSVVADGRDDAHPGDDDPPHACLVRIFNRDARAPPIARARSGSARLQYGLLAKQSNFEIERTVD